MSAIQAIKPDQPDQRTAEATLAHQCLYYMLMMRELEDRVTRELIVPNTPYVIPFQFGSSLRN